jgi:hypothetical protein
MLFEIQNDTPFQLQLLMHNICKLPVLGADGTCFIQCVCVCVCRRWEGSLSELRVTSTSEFISAHLEHQIKNLQSYKLKMNRKAGYVVFSFSEFFFVHLAACSSPSL